MTGSTYYRKKDSTAKEFFERLGRYIPLDSIEEYSWCARFATSDATMWIYCRDDEDISLVLTGPRERTLISRLVQGEASGWQQLSLFCRDGGLVSYTQELITSKFGGVSADDFRLQGEPELEEWEEDETDFNNLPPEILALDPINPYRAWRLHHMSPEEREEALRVYQDKERDQKNKAKQHAKLVRKMMEKCRQELLPLQPKVGRAWRHR